MSLNIVNTVPNDVGTVSPHKPISSSSGGSNFWNGLSTVGSAVSPYLGVGLNFLGNLLTNKSNRDMVDKQNEFALKMWNLNNAYNSPKNQISRLREASINPMLAMGNVDTGNSSSPVPSANPIPNTFGVDFTQAQSLNLQKEQNEIAQQNADTQRMAVESDLPVKKATELKTHAETKNLQQEYNKLLDERALLVTQNEHAKLQVDRQATENLYYELYGDDLMSSQASMYLAQAHLTNEQTRTWQQHINNESKQAVASLITAKSGAELNRAVTDLTRKRVDSFGDYLDLLVMQKKLTQNQAALAYKNYVNFEVRQGNEIMRTVIQGVSTGLDAVDTYNRSKNGDFSVPNAPTTDDYGFKNYNWSR